MKEPVPENRRAVSMKAPIVDRKPLVQNFSKKIDRIRENIGEDYDNDGFDSYSGSLKADKMR